MRNDSRGEYEPSRIVCSRYAFSHCPSAFSLLALLFNMFTSLSLSLSDPIFLSLSNPQIYYREAVRDSQFKFKQKDHP